MSQPEIISSLDDVIGRYDALICDVWGVIHNGREHFPAAGAALTRARERGVTVLLVSNVPKPRDVIPGQLDRLRFPRAAWDEIVTSGDAIRAELTARSPGPMYKIGPPHDAPLWMGLGLEYADLDAARFIAISGLNHDDVETPGDYAETLKQARARDLEMLCANPDIVVRVGDRLVWCAGAVAQDYAAIGGRVVMAGKPYAPIYRLSYRELEHRAGRAIDRTRILCIGDGIATDLKGATDQGLNALFIASGMHGEALQTNGALDAGKVEAALGAEGAAARYVMAALT